MTGPGQLPPDKVAQVDQRIAMYNTNLDTMINMYKSLVTQFGTAGAQVQLSNSFNRQSTLACSCASNAAAIKSNQAFRNLLIAAIARLADERGSAEQ